MILLEEFFSQIVHNFWPSYTPLTLQHSGGKPGECAAYNGHPEGLPVAALPQVPRLRWPGAFALQRGRTRRDFRKRIVGIGGQPMISVP